MQQACLKGQLFCRLARQASRPDERDILLHGVRGRNGVARVNSSRWDAL